jgi:hypothetical protein
VVIPTKYKHSHCWADCIHRFIWVVKQSNKAHNIPVAAIVGAAHLVQENNAASDRINSVWLANNNVDLDIY